MMGLNTTPIECHHVSVCKRQSAQCKSLPASECANGRVCSCHCGLCHRGCVIVHVHKHVCATDHLALPFEDVECLCHAKELEEPNREYGISVLVRDKDDEDRLQQGHEAEDPASSAYGPRVHEQVASKRGKRCRCGACKCCAYSLTIVKSSAHSISPHDGTKV